MPHISLYGLHSKEAGAPRVNAKDAIKSLFLHLPAQINFTILITLILTNSLKLIKWTFKSSRYIADVFQNI